MRSRWHLPWIGIILVVATLLGIGIFFKRGWLMSEPVMMYAGSEGPQFDASAWFAQGIYTRRQIELGGKWAADQVSMIRTNPPPFTVAQNNELSSWAFTALQRERPEVDAKSLLENPPDLRHRTLYRGSGFDEPNKPVDIYRLHLSLGGKRYVLSIERDGVSGNITHARGVLEVSASDTNNNSIFDRIEAEEKLRKNQ